MSTGVHSPCDDGRETGTKKREKERKKKRNEKEKEKEKRNPKGGGANGSAEGTVTKPLHTSFLSRQVRYIHPRQANTGLTCLPGGRGKWETVRLPIRIMSGMSWISYRTETNEKKTKVKSEIPPNFPQLIRGHNNTRNNLDG